MNTLPDDVQIWLLATWCDYFTRAKIKMVSHGLGPVAILAQQQVEVSLGRHFLWLEKRTAQLKVAAASQLWKGTRYWLAETKHPDFPDCALCWTDRGLTFEYTDKIVSRVVTLSVRQDALFVVEVTRERGAATALVSIEQYAEDGTWVSQITLPAAASSLSIPRIRIVDASKGVLFVMVCAVNDAFPNVAYVLEYRCGYSTANPGGLPPQSTNCAVRLIGNYSGEIALSRPNCYLHLDQLHCYGVFKRLLVQSVDEPLDTEFLVEIKHRLSSDAESSFQTLRLPTEKLRNKSEPSLRELCVFEGNGISLLCVVLACYERSAPQTVPLALPYENRGFFVPIDTTNGKPVAEAALFITWSIQKNLTLKYAWFEDYGPDASQQSLSTRTWFAWFSCHNEQLAYIYRNDGLLMLRLGL